MATELNIVCAADGHTGDELTEYVSVARVRGGQPLTAPVSCCRSCYLREYAAEYPDAAAPSIPEAGSIIKTRARQRGDSIEAMLAKYTPEEIALAQSIAASPLT